MTRFTQQLPSHYTDKNNSKSAKAQFMKAIKKGSKNPLDQDPKERYTEILNEKMDKLKGEAMKGAKYSFQLPGTDASQCRQLSKGAQEIIEKIAQKQAKRDAKKREKADVVKIRPKAFTGLQGGRIDTRGYIYDSAGQWIMTVDKKSGKIKNKTTGSTVGKYNPNCSYSEHRICELISSLDTTKNDGWYAGSGGGGIYGDSRGSGWGESSQSCGGGDIWGNKSGGSDIWGNKSDDNNGWW